MKRGILAAAIAGRRQEVRLHQVNIYNFDHIGAHIGNAPEYQEFKKEMQARAAAERHEMGKVLMVLGALEAQRASWPWWRRWFA